MLAQDGFVVGVDEQDGVLALFIGGTQAKETHEIAALAQWQSQAGQRGFHHGGEVRGEVVAVGADEIHHRHTVRPREPRPRQVTRLSEVDGIFPIQSRSVHGAATGRVCKLFLLHRTTTTRWQVWLAWPRHTWKPVH